MANTAYRKKLKVDPKLLVLLGLAVVGTAVAWYLMFRSTAVNLTAEAAPSEKFDVAVLRDPRFAALVKPSGASVALPTADFGRPNPFLPIAVPTQATAPATPAATAAVPATPLPGEQAPAAATSTPL